MKMSKGQGRNVIL
jgi:hypothetical protein